MAVAETSKIAYHSLKNLSEMQSKVHEAIGELGLAHDQEILDYLVNKYPNDNWAINTVTGRRNEVVKYGYAECHGLKMGRAGTLVKSWCVINPNDVKLKEMAYDCE